MDKTLIKVFICTDNYYMYKGIIDSLSERLNCHFVWIKDIDDHAPAMLKDLGAQDVVILLNHASMIDFYFLLKLCKSQSKVIMANSEQNWFLNIMFGFVIIGERFYLSDLLIAIHTKNKASYYAQYPKFTNQEKKVLFYTSKGHSIFKISQYMSISEKTIYQHQRNALNKIGISKPRGIVGLPKNFFHFMLQK